MEVEEVGTFARLCESGPEWQVLLDAAEHWDLFQTREWQVTWLETFWPGRAVAFQFVRHQRELVAVLPLLVDEDGEGWCRPRVVSPVNPHARRSGIAVRGEFRTCLNAVLSHVRRRPEGARLALRQIEVSGCADITAVGRRHGLATCARNQTDAPTVLMEENWEMYLKQLPTQVRRNREGKERKLSKAGQVEIRVSHGPNDLEAFIEAVLVVERSSWKEGRGTSVANEPGLGDFYPRLMRRFGARGQCRVYVLWLDGRPIAHVTGILIRGRFFALKTAFDEASRQLSPGAVLFWNVIRDGFERGWTELDFLGDNVRWKAELGNRAMVCVDLHIFPTYDLGCQLWRLLEERVKPVLRQVPGLPRLVRRLRGSGESAGPGGGR